MTIMTYGLFVSQIEFKFPSFEQMQKMLLVDIFGHGMTYNPDSEVWRGHSVVKQKPSGNVRYAIGIELANL